jgi:hypothetical protein
MKIYSFILFLHKHLYNEHLYLYHYYINNKTFFLATGGDLQRYLDGLANAENMVEFVDQHPFGREHINKQSEYWNFYVYVVYILYLYAPEKVFPSIGM